MTRSTCWNNEQTLKKSKSYRTAWNPIQILALREEDLEASAMRGTNRAIAPVNIYWSSRSFRLKQSFNQILHKWTKVDSIRLSQTWRKSDRIPKSYALHHVKQISPKLPSQLMPMTGVTSGFATSKDKTKSNPLARQKVRILSKRKSQDLIKRTRSYQS